MSFKAKQVKPVFTKTYASEANAVKAVEKVFPAGGNGDLRYIVVPVTVEGKLRYSPLFVGNSAIEAGAHFHFNCVN